MQPFPDVRTAGARRRTLPARLLVVSVLSLLTLALMPGAVREAAAIKWRECPGPPSAAYPSTIGASNAPFAHPGHALRISLNQAELAATGGFSVEPDGNEVEIVLASLFGAPVPLAPRRATAISPDVLELTFPDSEAETGRPLVGPAEVVVRSGGRVVAHVAAHDLVALPPASDLTGLVLGDDRQVVVPAALAADGDLWIPVRFQGDPMAMPGCPGNYIQPMPILVGGAVLAEQLGGRRDPLRRLRPISLYLGDVVINDASYYGEEFVRRLPTMHVAGTLGVSLCKMNDSIDLVLRVQGSRSWASSEHSPFKPAVADAGAVLLELRVPRPAPGDIAWLESNGDTFGSSCSATPAEAVRDGAARRDSPPR